MRSIRKVLNEYIGELSYGKDLTKLSLTVDNRLELMFVPCDSSNITLKSIPVEHMCWKVIVSEFRGYVNEFFMILLPERHEELKYEKILISNSNIKVRLEDLVTSPLSYNNLLKTKVVQLIDNNKEGDTFLDFFGNFSITIKKLQSDLKIVKYKGTTVGGKLRRVEEEERTVYSVTINDLKEMCDVDFTIVYLPTLERYSKSLRSSGTELIDRLVEL